MHRIVVITQRVKVIDFQKFLKKIGFYLFSLSFATDGWMRSSLFSLGVEVLREALEALSPLGVEQSTGGAELEPVGEAPHRAEGSRGGRGGGTSETLEAG